MGRSAMLRHRDYIAVSFRQALSLSERSQPRAAVPQRPASEPEFHANPIDHAVGPNPGPAGLLNLHLGEPFHPGPYPGVQILVAKCDTNFEDILGSHDGGNGVNAFHGKINRPIRVTGRLQLPLLAHLQLADLVFGNGQFRPQLFELADFIKLVAGFDRARRSWCEGRPRRSRRRWAT